MLQPHIPESFAKGLLRDFAGAIRLRWSPARNRWQIERKGREVAKNVDPKDRLDTWIRVRDGFYRIMETSPGSLICCSFCGADYSHPMFTLQAGKCSSCQKEEFVMNWPLGDRLLEHLRFTDPDRDGLKRMWKDLEASEKALVDGQERNRRNLGEDIWKDEFTRVFDIQSRGYEGPASAWENAPTSHAFGGNFDGIDSSLSK